MPKLMGKELIELINSRKKIIIDPGKNTVKIFLMLNGQIKCIAHFPSLSELTWKFKNEPISNQYQISFQWEGKNRNRVVGAGLSSDQSMNTEPTKNNEHHMACIHTAIHKHVRDGEEVDVIVGYPSSYYKNDSMRLDYYSKIMGEELGRHTVTVNGQEKTYTIKELKVYKEGYGYIPRLKYRQAAAKDAELHAEPEAFHVLDFGGENINYHRVTARGEFLESYSLDEAGVNHLFKMYRKEMAENLEDKNYDLNNIDWTACLKTKKIRGISELDGIGSTKQFIEDVGTIFLDKQFTRLQNDVGFNVKKKGDKIVFLGGGSLTLQELLTNYLESNSENILFSDHPLWDNCFSYAILYYMDIKAKHPSDKELGREVNKILKDILKQGTSAKFEEKRLSANQEDIVGSILE